MKNKFLKNRFYILENETSNLIVFDVETNEITVCEKDINLNTLLLQARNNHIQKNIPPEMKRTIDYVIVGVAETCNLCCSYCYAEHGTYGNSTRKIMTFEELKIMLNKLLEITPKGIDGMCFFGGEPLLAFSAIKQFIEYAVPFLSKKGLPVPRWGIVTNGTLLTQEKIEFFNKYHFSVNVSLDGPKEINDKTRIFANSSESVYDVVKKNLSTIETKEFILCCQATLNEEFFLNYKVGYYKNFINSMYSLGYDYVAPLIAQSDKTIKINDLLKRKIKQFYTDMIDFDFICLIEGISLKEVSASTLTIIDRLVKSEYHLSCKAGIESIYYSAYGHFYRCHLYYEMHEKNISENELLNKSVTVKYKDKSENSDCQVCMARNICFSWCPAVDRMLQGKHSEASCYAQVFSIEYVIKKLVVLQSDHEKYLQFAKNYIIAAERSANSKKVFID